MNPEYPESESPETRPPQDLSEGERQGLEDLIRGTFFQIDGVEIERRDGKNCDAVVDVSFEQQHARHHARSIQQTVGYFIRPGLRVPAFSASPDRDLPEPEDRAAC